MKKRIRLLSLALTLTMLLALLAGCGDTATTDAVSESDTQSSTESVSESSAANSGTDSAVEGVAISTQQSSGEESAVSEVAAAEEDTSSSALPISEETVTLTWFTSLLSASDQVYLATIADNVALQYLEEVTNVTIEPVECSSDTYQEKLNIMIAGGDCSDILYNAVEMVSNADLMVRDEVFLDLTDLIDEYMPNYKSILEEYDDFKAETTTAEGYIAAIYEFVEEPIGRNLGLFIRKDWLDELSLDVPVTYDDWYEVLEAFTTEKGATAAFGVQQSGIPIEESFSAGYGVALSPGYVTFQEDGYPFYQVDGVVKCGYLEDGFTDFITMMNEWYAAGYISPDFTSYEMPDAYSDDLMAGDTGAIFFFRDACDSLSGMASGEVISVASPVLNEGDTLHIGGYLSKIGEYSNSISSNCAYPEIAAQFIDYLYSEDGAIVCNYGAEGESMEYVDGTPQFTEIVSNAAEVSGDESFSTSVALNVYTFRRLGTRYLVDATNSLYSEAYASLTNTWYGNNDGAYDIPDYVVLTEEQNDAFNSLWSDIQTLILENVAKFISGDRPLSEISEFQADLRTMGIEECISFYQDACDTYLN